MGILEFKTLEILVPKCFYMLCMCVYADMSASFYTDGS